MIVRRREEIAGTARDASGPGWTSLRLLTRADGMGYTITDTQVLPGAALTLEYAAHLEACYCIEGRGTLTDLATGARHAIGPGTIYALDAHDRHEVRCEGDAPMRLICTFAPALRGDETHDASGGYRA